MSLAHDVVAFLTAAPHSLGPVYAASMPPTPNACGTVYETAGLAPERGFGVAGVAHENPGIQIVFRGEPNDFTGPRAKAEIAFHALAAVQPETALVAGGTVYHKIDPQQSPFGFGRGENQQHLIACNFLIYREPAA